MLVTFTSLRPIAVLLFSLTKSLKWYKNIVLHFIDLAVMNAYLLCKNLGGSKKQEWLQLEFIHSLAIANKQHPRPLADAVPIVVQPFITNKASDLSRLQGQHFMDLLPPTAMKTNPTTKCILCNMQGNSKETRYFCKTCLSKPSLCVVPCFEKYHTVVDLSHLQ